MELAKVKHQLDTDPEKEVKGVEVRFEEDFFVVVARANNPRAQKLLQEILSEPATEMARKAGAINPERWDEIMIEVAAQAILVGWRGLTDGGKEVPYSVEKSRELLKMKDFRDRISELAKTQEIYRRDMVEKAADTLG